jgi:hypothetical protein
MRINITYSNATEEELEAGEPIEFGWYVDTEGVQLHVPCLHASSTIHLEAVFSLRCAIGFIRRRGVGYIQLDNAGLSAQVDPSFDDTTGVRTDYTVHFAGMSQGSAKRIERLLQSF